MAGLEQAALSGELFHQHRSTSPTRTASTSSQSPTSSRSRSPEPNPQPNANILSNRSQGAQTGPKGVISDRKAQDRYSKIQVQAQQRELRDQQERRGLVGLTLDDEDALREREKDARDKGGEMEEGVREWRRRRMEELEREKERLGEEGGRARRGGLREVGKEGFVNAVERPGWVVVLIYEPDIPRCNALLASTLHLSLNLPPTSTNPFSSSSLTLFRARASNLAFSLLPSIPDEEGEEEGRPDPDVLPTLLAYRDGELEKTWIRVDWDVGEDGVEGLLRKEGILGNDNQSFSAKDDGSDDDD